VTLVPHLEVRLAERRERRRELSVRREGEALVWQVDGPSYQAVLRLVPEGDAQVLVEVRLRYSKDVRVRRESLTLRVPGRARVVGRDLAFSALTRPLRVDRGTPVVAFAQAQGLPGVVVVGGMGIPAARYAPGKDEASLELILDDEDSHPFSVFAACRATYLPRHDGDPERRRPPAELQERKGQKARTRKAGEIVVGHARLYLTRPSAPFQPLVVERWPLGARAAVVFTDHADRTDPTALRAVLYGTSDRKASAYGAGGFLGHGLRLTKTFFAEAQVGSLARDPQARALAEELLRAGSEVGSHSPSPGRDARPEVQRGLSVFAPFGTVTWIDHQPETNCEAFANQGWKADGRYGVRDLLADAGFRWVWAASDLPSRGLSLANVFAPAEENAARAPIFPLPGDPRLWVFRSSWFYGKPKALAAAISESALDRLEAERGLFVGHTYLAASPHTTTKGYLRRRDLVRRHASGALELEPIVDAALGRLGTRVRRGSIASLTWSQAGDRLKALGQVEVRYLDHGEALVENHGDTAILGLTLAMPVTDVDIEVEGQRMLGSRADAGRTAVWLDLPARGVVRLRVRPRAGTLAFLGEGRVSLEARP
jgi:hypothetical protein